MALESLHWKVFIRTVFGPTRRSYKKVVLFIVEALEITKVPRFNEQSSVSTFANNHYKV